MQARINNNFGRIYIASKDFSTGILYYKKALSAFEKGNDSYRKATVYMNLGAAYDHIGKVDSSRLYLEKAMTIFRAINNQPNLGTCYSLYSYTLLPEKRYEEALDFLDKGFTIANNPTKPENRINEVSAFIA